MSDAPNKPAKIYKANKVLQSKVGTGPIDEKTRERCNRVIEHNTIDFAPLAQEFLDQLTLAINNSKSGELNKTQAIQAMTEPVMQLKANAKTFKYSLISNLANIMLSFLEGIEDLDNDAIEIVNAHHKTLTAIILKKMKGDGGTHGTQFESELKSACDRYFSSKK